MIYDVACNDWFNEPPRAHASIHLASTAVCFDGPIDAGDDRLVSEALKARPRQTLVVVRSSGGNAEAGLKIAETIRANASTVVVRDYCVSTCANYLFVPATRRYVLHASFVGFHGGISNRATSNGLNQIEALADTSASERTSMKQEWSANLKISLARQDALLRSLGRPA